MHCYVSYRADIGGTLDCPAVPRVTGSTYSITFDANYEPAVVDPELSESTAPSQTFQLCCR